MVSADKLTLPEALTLSTPDLTLRPWAATDLPALLAAGADPLVRRFRYSVPRDRAEAVRWLGRVQEDRRIGRRLELAITETPDGAPLGSIALFDFAHHNALVSYWLAAPGRGRGLATRALHLLASELSGRAQLGSRPWN